MSVSLAAVVVAVLRTVGSQSVGVAEAGCGAIWNLAADDETNRTALGAAGACKGKCMSTRIDYTAIEQGCCCSCV